MYNLIYNVKKHYIYKSTTSKDRKLELKKEKKGILQG